MAGPQGARSRSRRALLHFSRRIDVAVWSVERVPWNELPREMKERLRAEARMER